MKSNSALASSTRASASSCFARAKLERLRRSEGEAIEVPLSELFRICLAVSSSTFLDVATNAYSADVASRFCAGANFSAALDEPLLYNGVTSDAEGGA